MTHAQQSTLFATNNFFTLSGAQPYQKKEFAIPEKKVRIFDVKKADVDEIYERRMKKCSTILRAQN